jgi:hypothetical protein
MSDQYHAKFSYRTHKWQLRISEAIFLKLYAALAASTGLVKTTPFILPLNVKQEEAKESILFLISPTQKLHKYQAKSTYSTSIVLSTHSRRVPFRKQVLVQQS